ncbi:MAG TPA: phage protein Gp36 family protein [Allosphingosinicella sp.]|nr:phage protein Gp36 family protein [Allosphingosinicella sp.]
MQSFVKQPAELLKKAVAFDTAAAIASIIDVSAAKRGLVVGSAGLVVAGELVAGMLFVSMSGGTDGEHYLVTARAEDADGQELEGEIELAVIDGAWVMPDGGDGYISIKEFVDHFGIKEVVLMTDAAGDGRIDRDYLITALAAVQALADAWISNRYQVPLADAPAVVKVAIADMARARLYPRGAPEGVDGNAKAAQRILEQIGSGKLPLPGLDATAEAPSSAPIAVSAGQRQYPDGLKDY